MDIHIRRLKTSDFESLAAIFDDEHVVAQTSQLPYRTVDEWRAHWKPEHSTSIVAVWEQQAVGKVTLWPKRKPRERHIGVLGIAVHPAHHGKGIGTKLMAAALDLADNWLNLKRVELQVFTTNVPAVKLYEKFGFVIEGEAKYASFAQGAYRNLYYMARVREG